MADTAPQFEHRDVDKKDDDTLREEARAYLARKAELQLVSELLTKLRAMALPWWTPETLRARFPASTRLAWFRDRADIRQQITVALTGLAPRAARRQSPAAQAELIDAVLDEEDVTHAAFENAFEPADIAVYGPAGEIWRELRERLPWEQDTPEHQELVAWLIRALLADASAEGGFKRKPILTPWDVRTRIQGRVWHTHIPLELRVAVDEARHTREKEHPRKVFHAADDLAIVTAEVITQNIPLRDLVEIFSAAEAAMGFQPPPLPQIQPPVIPPGARAGSIPPPALGKGSIPPPPRPPRVPELSEGEDAASSSRNEPQTLRKPAPQAANEVVIANASSSDGADDVVSSAPASRPAPPPQKAVEGDDEDLARTNQWATPSVDDLWTHDGH